MTTWYTENMQEICKAILSLQNEEECRAFLEDVCTIKEIQDLSQRFQVAGMLSRGISYSTICKETGASTATISRVSKCYAYGTGGYRTVIKRMRGENGDD